MEQTIWVCNQCDKFCGAVDEASHVAVMMDKFCIGCDENTRQTAIKVTAKLIRRVVEYEEVLRHPIGKT